MRLECLLVALAVAFSPGYAVPQGIQKLDVSSNVLVPPWAVEDRAVSVVKLRVPWNEVEQYLADYAKWYLPVDQFVCNKEKYPEHCESSSGRKLLSALVREHGDNYNLVFMWSYESAWKQDYYCKYTKAFFQYHAADKDLETFYTRVRDARGGKESLKQTIAAFPPRCGVELKGEQIKALELARDTIHEIEIKQFAPKIESEEGSWNFEVNLCKLAVLKKNPGLPSTAFEDPKNPLCPKSKQSLLERAVREIKWEMPPKE